VTVPWSRFELINAFNSWKTSESAGRVFVVAPDRTATKLVTGLSWRTQISAQVFEEAAVDLSRGLARMLGREHTRIASIRRNFLHEISSKLAKTHSELAVEDLPVANLIRTNTSPQPSRCRVGRVRPPASVQDGLARGELVVCNRWFPSTKTCSACGGVADQMALGRGPSSR
jgi:hypothetical protein